MGAYENLGEAYENRGEEHTRIGGGEHTRIGGSIREQGGHPYFSYPLVSSASFKYQWAIRERTPLHFAQMASNLRLVCTVGSHKSRGETSKRGAQVPDARPISSLSNALLKVQSAKSSAAVFLLEIPETSIESLEKAQSGRWSLEVLHTIWEVLVSKSRPWNPKYENRKYENGRIHHQGSIAFESVRAAGQNARCYDHYTCICICMRIYKYIYIYICIYTCVSPDGPAARARSRTQEVWGSSPPGRIQGESVPSLSQLPYSTLSANSVKQVFPFRACKNNPKQPLIYFRGGQDMASMSLPPWPTTRPANAGGGGRRRLLSSETASPVYIYIYIYIYTHKYTCICVCIYIYIYI